MTVQGTFTRAQVAKALTINGISGDDEQEIIATLSAMCTTMMDVDGTIYITGEELREALRRQLSTWKFKDGKQSSSVFTYAGLADALLINVLANREPMWDVGDLVQSEENTIWLRTTSGGWKRVGSSGTYDHSVPHRPLRLLSKGVKE